MGSSDNGIKLNRESNEKSMAKAIIIARVSTAKQEKEGLSLMEIQLPELKRYAEEKGFEVVQEFTFSETADSKIRKKFNHIIEIVQGNPDIKAIISFRVDRATRNYRDAVLFDNLRMDYDKELHFVHDRLVLTKKSSGRDIQDWDTKVYLAKQVINRLREDAYNSAQAKLTNGELPGKAPFGYRNFILPNTNNKKSVQPDDFEALVVKKMFEWYSTGAYSMLLIRDMLKSEFDLKMDKGKIDFILKCTFYYGDMLHDGQVYPHKYERLITKELFDKVQQIKASYGKKHHKFAGLPYMYRGQIRCAECGLSITPEKHKGIVYYHCTEYNGKHDAEWLTEAQLTEQFKDLFSKLKVPDSVLNDLIESLKKAHNDKTYNYKLIFDELNSEYMKYENRIEKMYEDKLDGRITQDMYDKKYNEGREKQEGIKAKMSGLQKADEEYYITSAYLLNIASRASELFESSEPDEKRELLKLLLLNCTLDGRILRYDLKKPFDSIFFFGNSHIWLYTVKEVRTALVSVCA